MKHTKVTHFWEWFERHHTMFLDLDSLTRTERQYWLAELDGHVTAYNRFLMPEIQEAGSGPSKQCRLIISAIGRSSSFRKVDQLLKQAPRLRAWEMIALDPPAGFDETAAGMLQRIRESIGKLWFDVRHMEETGKAALNVFSEGYVEFDLDCIYKVDELVYHMVGEKVYGLCFGGVRVESYDWLAEDDQSYLAPLEQLPDFMKARQLPGMVGGGTGVGSIGNVRLTSADLPYRKVGLWGELPGIHARIRSGNP